MEVFPAVDVTHGRLARLEGKRIVRVDQFGGDPLAAARAFLDAGASWIHVVDLDLAFEGELRNDEVVWRISELGARVQASGGVRGRDKVELLLGAGAERVVLGSAGLVEPSEIEIVVSEFGSRVVIGLELEGERLRARGCSQIDLDLGHTMGWLRRLGPDRYLATVLGRVGDLSGPDLSGLRRVIELAQAPVIAAGGIATVDDLRRLGKAGVEGVVIGRALYEGTIETAVALGVASEFATG